MVTFEKQTPSGIDVNLQAYPCHYPSKTGTLCVWPIVWLVGCVVGLTPGCTRILLQPDQVHLLFVKALLNASGVLLGSVPV